MIRYVPLGVLRVLAICTAWLMNLQPQRGMLRKVRLNLQLAFPDMPNHEREHLAKISVQKQCLSYVEALKSWAMPPQWSIDQIADVHGLEPLKHALSQSQGTLFITPHLGTWEMMNAWFSQYANPIIMYKPIRQPQLNQFILQARQRLNATLVPTDASGVKLLFKNLKNGGSSIILPDHVPPLNGGVIVPFFGVPCLTGTLTAKMAAKTGCVLMGLSCLRREDGRFDVYCDRFDDPALYDGNVEVATAALNRAVEQLILRAPADYMWGYKRFKGVAEIERLYAQSN